MRTTILAQKEIVYLKNTEEILINFTTKIKDNFGNKITLEKLNYNLNNKLLKGKKVKLQDIQKNFYNLI